MNKLQTTLSFFNVFIKSEVGLLHILNLTKPIQNFLGTKLGDYLRSMKVQVNRWYLFFGRHCKASTASC